MGRWEGLDEVDGAIAGETGKKAHGWAEKLRLEGGQLYISRRSGNNKGSFHRYPSTCSHGQCQFRTAESPERGRLRFKLWMAIH